MISKDIEFVNKTQLFNNINPSIIQRISSLNLLEDRPNFDIATGLFSTLCDKDQRLREFFDQINQVLKIYLQVKPYDMKPSSCIKCGSEDIAPHQLYDKSMKDLLGNIELKVQRYYCKSCGSTFSMDDNPLNIEECQISMPLSRLMVLLYNGGLSLRYTADLISATYHVTIHHDTVREHVLKWGYKIRKDYRNDLTRKKAKEMQMDEQYVTIRCQDPRDSSVQIIVKLDSLQNRIVDLKVNTAKQITDLDTRLALDQLEELPDTLITDGAKGIASATEDYDIEHRICLQHRVRNVRKSKYVKNTILQLSRDIIEEKKRYDENKWHIYKRKVIEELTELLKSKKIVKKTGRREILHVNKMRDEDLENKFGKHVKKTREKFYQAYLQRRLYCGFEAAERMSYVTNRGYSMQGALELTLTTGKLEGYNRLIRCRERKALCFRSIETVEALAYLNAEFYNYRRGHGLVETPFNGFNQIDVSKIGLQGRPITIRKKKYGQQFSRKIAEVGVTTQLTPLVIAS